MVIRLAFVDSKPNESPKLLTIRVRFKVFGNSVDTSFVIVQSPKIFSD